MKVLIIQQKMIGDVLTSSILFEAIKQHYPDSELHYVLNSHTYPVVKHHPFVDRFHLFTPEHEGSIKGLVSFSKTLKKEAFDVVIDAYSKWSSNVMTVFSGASQKITKYKWYTQWLYTHPLKYNTIPKTHAGLAIENRMQLLAPLGINTAIIRPKIYLSDKEKSDASRFLTSNGIDLKKNLFMIGVLGSGTSKTYPFDYMATVINTIASLQPDCQILFNYIPKQEDDAKAIYELCDIKTKKQIFFNVFGKSLRDFLAITSHCTALIGNEGGATNMAKALHIPTFTIFSPWIKKEAWNMFDDGKSHVSVHLKDVKPKLYDNVDVYKTLKENYKALYKEFAPILFEEKLKQFVKQF